MTNILQISYPLFFLPGDCMWESSCTRVHMFTCMSRADGLSQCCRQGDGERGGIKTEFHLSS